MQPKKLTRKEKAILQKQSEPAKKAVAKKSTRLRFILALIVATAGFLVYANTLGHNYVLDDYSLILENRITKQGISAIPEIFKTTYRHGYVMVDDEVYRPLSKAMFALEWELSPDNAFLGHLVNVILYALTGFILFITLHLFTKNYLLSFLASLLFIVHPVHTEVVANIKSRDEIACFLMLTVMLVYIYKYIESKKVICILFAGISYFIAFLSKETAITFLAIIPMMLYFFTAEKTFSILKTTGFMLIPAVLFLLIRSKVVGAAVPETVSIADNLLMAANSKSSQLATAFYILLLYLKILVFPHPLVFDYSYNQIPIMEATDWKFILSFVIHVALIVYAVMRFKKKDIFSFGILFYFITISLVSNLVIIIGSSMAERFLYIPSFGFCFILAAALVKIFKAENVSVDSMGNFFRKYSKPVIAAFVIGILFSVKTIARNTVWKDNLTLYLNDVELSPNSTRTHYYLGNYLTKPEQYGVTDEKMKMVMLDSAISELQRSVAIYPRFADAWNQIGVAYGKKKDHARAEQNYKKAIEANPTNSTVHNNIGTVYFETGRFNEAIQSFENALKYDPNYVDATANLGCTFGEVKQYDKAIQYLNRAVKLDPSFANGWYFLGITYRLQGNEAMAQQNLNKAYAINPSLKK